MQTKPRFPSSWRFALKDVVSLFRQFLLCKNSFITLSFDINSSSSGND